MQLNLNNFLLTLTHLDSKFTYYFAVQFWFHGDNLDKQLVLCQRNNFAAMIFVA